MQMQISKSFEKERKENNKDVREETEFHFALFAVIFIGSTNRCDLPFS